MALEAVGLQLGTGPLGDAGGIDHRRQPCFAEDHLLYLKIQLLLMLLFLSIPFT